MRESAFSMTDSAVQVSFELTLSRWFYPPSSARYVRALKSLGELRQNNSKTSSALAGALFAPGIAMPSGEIAISIGRRLRNLPKASR